MKILVEAIGKAYERAKGEEGNKTVLAHMNNKQNGKAKLPLVKWLVVHDNEFVPSTWYAERGFQTATNVGAFKKLLDKVERHTDVRWLSWLPSEGGTDVAPIA